MPRRDPDTGQFVAGDSFADIEVVTFRGDAAIPAADLTGATGINGEFFEFEGAELVDYDTVVDRNEELTLLSATHALSVYANSTETADGTVAASAEISSSPSAIGAASNFGAAVTTFTDSVDGNVGSDDSIDFVGRPLAAVAGAPFSDGASGVGGAGSAGEDRVEVEDPPGNMARFHPRDELFMNGSFRVWNIDDAGVHLHVSGQHVYGVTTQ